MDYLRFPKRTPCSRSKHHTTCACWSAEANSPASINQSATKANVKPPVCLTTAMIIGNPPRDQLDVFMVSDLDTNEFVCISGFLAKCNVLEPIVCLHTDCHKIWEPTPNDFTPTCFWHLVVCGAWKNHEETDKYIWYTRHFHPQGGKRQRFTSNLIPFLWEEPKTISLFIINMYVMNMQSTQAALFGRLSHSKSKDLWLFGEIAYY